MDHKPYTILYVDDEEINLTFFSATFSWEYNVITALSAADAIRLFQENEVDLVVADQRMPGMSGVEFFEHIYGLNPEPARILLTGYGDLETIIQAVNQGKIFHFFQKPWVEQDLIAAFERALKIRTLQRENEGLIAHLKKSNDELSRALGEIQSLTMLLEEENQLLREEVNDNFNFDDIVSNSVNFQEILHRTARVAATEATVLITGETGTGKELLARAVHRLSKRRQKPFIKINCAALPIQLIESELFGHEKGAFTGAVSSRPGRFELAHQGTIFLDEIGDFPLELQAKLLRVLQEGEFDRLGATKTTKVDVRVIAATHVDLNAAVRDGKFRADLFYRLNVFPIHTPPLRERQEDIPMLVRHFVRKYALKNGKVIRRISKKTYQLLQAHHWPGNIRELENVIERGVIMSKTDKFKMQPGELGSTTVVAGSQNGVLESLDQNERLHIVRALQQTNWRVTGDQGAARLLQINERTLQSRIRKLQIRRPKELDD
ncbi:sigma-54-dependent transcriptional regulator [Dyadobacter psychrotolerans]|uniref:Sigma-54-dependent Fis family transcriptional regulator n=1 Tax=Dyadobacter psychrotolerans TaxID=2541721 RepID=A0A4R5D6H0_9BACT|nr:sigma-54 dependent transcriptional regulator [Dyadobacter psychrotolerans]TDE09006.1 sigma-54-dependent Fis family transcriptional regulator [Dyadobacter psychrotolerans]